MLAVPKSMAISLVRKLKKPIELDTIRRNPSCGRGKIMGKGTEGFGGHVERDYGIVEESSASEDD